MLSNAQHSQFELAVLINTLEAALHPQRVEQVVVYPDEIDSQVIQELRNMIARIRKVKQPHRDLQELIEEVNALPTELTRRMSRDPI